MGLPAGVHTCVISVGPYTNGEGTSLPVLLAVTPVFGNGVSFVTWNADGSAITNKEIAGHDMGDGTSTVTVPVVNQAGWIDPSASAYTMWYYKVSWSTDGIKGTKNIQPLDGQSFIDMDKVASGPVGAPVSTPIAVVTSVGGFTGDVTVEDLETLGITGGGGGSPAWADITGKPAYIAAGATASDARSAIAAVGATHDHPASAITTGVFSIERAVPGARFTCIWNGDTSKWTYNGADLTGRPSDRTDIFFDLVGAPAATADPAWAITGDQRLDV